MDYGSELDARAHPPNDLIWQLPLRRIMLISLFVSAPDTPQLISVIQLAIEHRQQLITQR